MQGFTHYPTHYPAPEPPRRTPVGLIITAVVVAVVLIGLGGGYVGYRIITGTLAARHQAAPATSPTTAQPIQPAQPAPSDTATPAPDPTAVGMVDVSAVADQGQAVPVAGMFDAYFGGIDSGDTAQALAEYDPAGVVDPADPAQASAFAQAVATTDDSAVSLIGLDSDRTGRGAVQARVLFTSHQAAGYGPSGDPDQTCTRWDITYILTYDQTAGYRILDNSRHANSAC